MRNPAINRFGVSLLTCLIAAFGITGCNNSGSSGGGLMVVGVLM